MTYIRNRKNNECNQALERVFGSIKIDEINEFIDGINCMSHSRKEFYKYILNFRYEILKETQKVK